jgi:hypothetical protein
MRASIVLLALAASACASTGPASNAAKLVVEFSWEKARPCSNESPEIKVFNAPAGTARLRFELVDLDALFSSHGGGVVDYKGTPLVPAGALRDYRGPCPQGGKTTAAVQYELRVSALDTKGAVIGYGTATQSYIPPRLAPGVRR